MRLDGKVAIRSLNDVSFPYAPDLFCPLPLLLEIAYMLDYGVREYDFKLLIFLLPHVSCVAADAGDIGKCRLVRFCQIVFARAHCLCCIAGTAGAVAI